MKIYLVGGAVRNQLLGLPVDEKDWVVVGSCPEEMIKLGYKPVGKSFPVFLHPKTHEEYALARTEKKTSLGYKGFEFRTDKTISLEQDLLRRDLTINAIAQDDKGHLIDPHGGQQDIHDKILRHVSPAFVEDPVRILRTARLYAQFAPLGFTLAPETVALMRTMVKNGEINALVPERIWQEFHKALLSKAPSKFIEALRMCDALKKIMPELDALFGVPNKIEYHPEVDSGIHTLMVLEQAVKLSPDPEVRFSALVHDLGKALTPQSEWPSHKGHEHKGIMPINKLCDRLKVPTKFKRLALLTGKYHGLIYQAFSLRAVTILRLFEQTDAFRQPGRFNQFLLACEADNRGRPGFEKQHLPHPDYLLAALTAARTIDIKTLVARNKNPLTLATQIRAARIKAIKNVVKSNFDKS